MYDANGPAPRITVQPIAPAPPMDLSDRVAVVTGASSGLGARFATLLAANGAKVVATARRADRLERLAAAIRAEGGVCEPYALDVRDAGQIQAVFDHATSTFGVVNVLVNNAGVPDRAPAHELTVDEIDASLATNVRGPFLLACECARRLIAAGMPGHIVNISSIGAFVYTGGGRALYSTTKAAVTRMTETLAVEWVEHGINVNGLAPGAFLTEMLEELIEQMGDVSGNFPRRRIGDPAQLDSSLLYLLSPASGFVTGTVIKVDDGQRPR